MGLAKENQIGSSACATLKSVDSAGEHLKFEDYSQVLTYGVTIFFFFFFFFCFVFFFFFYFFLFSLYFMSKARNTVFKCSIARRLYQKKIKAILKLPRKFLNWKFHSHNQ